MIDIETKIPYSTFIDWEEEKAKIKKEGRSITLEKFINFYAEKVTREEDAQYLRQNVGYEERRSPQNSNKALLLRTNTRIVNRMDHDLETRVQHNRINGVSRGRINNGRYRKDHLTKPSQKTPNKATRKGYTTSQVLHILRDGRP